MAKLTQFGRMRRRIKRELDAARAERAAAAVRTAALLASGAAMISVIRSATIAGKVLGSAQDAFHLHQDGDAPRIDVKVGRVQGQGD